MKKNGNLEMMVRATANNPIDTKLNLVQFKKQKAKALRHKNVCKEVVDFADKNPSMPFYAILSIGVGSGSFKVSEYNKGYIHFNKNKTYACLRMAEIYNKTLGIKGKPSDITWRLVNRFYNKVSHNEHEFEKILADTDKEVMDDKRGHFLELCYQLCM